MLTISKLSQLQRYILIEAAKKAEARRDGPYDVLNAEILVGFFKIPTDPKGSEWSVCGHISGIRFNPAPSDRARYASARAAVSRATGRLQARGLVECIVGLRSKWAGIKLTEHGHRVLAQQIMPGVHTWQPRVAANALKSVSARQEREEPSSLTLKRLSAKESGVSLGVVQRIQYLLRHGDPDTINAVRSGQISAKQANQQIRERRKRAA
jgi:hypothetical protein